MGFINQFITRGALGGTTLSQFGSTLLILKSWGFLIMVKIRPGDKFLAFLVVDMPKQTFFPSFCWVQSPLGGLLHCSISNSGGFQKPAKKHDCSPFIFMAIYICQQGVPPSCKLPKFFFGENSMGFPSEHDRQMVGFSTSMLL